MRQTKYDYSIEKISDAVLRSSSIAGTLRILGMPQGGNTRDVVTKKIKDNNIDTSHHTGQGHQPTGTTHNKLDWEDVLVYQQGRERKALQLRRALVEFGRVYLCSICQCNDEWNGKTLVLQVDHIDGDRYNNKPENLRFLCPNCYTQTENWGIKNMVRLVQ